MGGRRARDRSVVLMVVAFMAFTAAALIAPRGLSPATAAGRYRITTARVGPGVVLQRIVDRRGPNRIRVLRVDPQKQPVIDVALANDTLPGHERTSSMARRHGAVAAINGDYTLRPSQTGAGRPVDIFAEDGHLKASPLIWGRNFSISRDEQSITIGHNRLLTWLTQHDSAETWNVSVVNPVTPDRDGFSAYTRAGGRSVRPPPRACAARLFLNGDLAWTSARDGVTRDYYVDRVVCRDEPLPRLGGVVISAPLGTANAALLQASLFEGETVTYGWSIRRTGVLDTIGGNPDLLDDGQYAIGQCTSSSFCGRNPRTGIGATPEGLLLLITVDGRQPGRSVGMTLWEFADLFRFFGATEALNLDGGGSTTMVVRDRIVNRPSGGYERAVGSALLVLLQADDEEVEPVPFVGPDPEPTPAPSVTPTDGATAAVGASLPSLAPIPGTGAITSARLDPGCASLRDPGSTGGLLHALARGDLGAERRALPSSLRWALRVFRGTAPCAARG
ncbi:MAG: phosphodiester glycosidase family protein [Actinomycetota bacterium]|nr:phosphodiester glycosidase family protein [Actinomycetota bacterium]